MPITDKGFEYTIPPEYKNMISPEFLQTFQREMKKVFDNDWNYQDEESWTYAGGSGGWQIAFTKAGKLHKLDALVKYYDSLPWYDSDIFDGEVTDLAILYGVVDPMPPVTFWDRVKGQFNYRWWGFRIDVDNFIKRLKRK